MKRHRRTPAVALSLALSRSAGAPPLQQMAALRSVSFAFANVSDVKLVGIPINESTSFSGSRSWTWAR